MAGPVVCVCLRVTICTILQSEIELTIVAYFFDSDKVVVVVEFVDGWEVPVLLAHDLASIRIGISEHESGALFRDNTLNTNANECRFLCLIESLLLLLDCFFLLARHLQPKLVNHSTLLAHLDLILGKRSISLPQLSLQLGNRSISLS